MGKKVEQINFSRSTRGYFADAENNILIKTSYASAWGDEVALSDANR